MLTSSASVPSSNIAQQRARRQHTTPGSKWWACCQTEVRGHLSVLEQATMAVFAGYLSGPLYYRAGHAAQRLLTLVETVAWREGTRIAYEIAHLFHSDVVFDLVHALHLSELLAALYRAMALPAARPFSHTVASETRSMAKVTLAFTSK